MSSPKFLKLKVVSREFIVQKTNFDSIFNDYGKEILLNVNEIKEISKTRLKQDGIDLIEIHTHYCFEYISKVSFEDIEVALEVLEMTKD